jgi:hypothetical protein
MAYTQIGKVALVSNAGRLEDPEEGYMRWWFGSGGRGEKGSAEGLGRGGEGTYIGT